MRVFQILTTISFGDAVSNDCLAIRDLLEKEGFETYIYAENLCVGADKLRARNVRKLPKIRKDDIILYHLSTGTELNEKIKTYDCRKYMIYHNTTPPEFFVPYSGKLSRLCSRGLDETRALKDTFDGCFAVSEFNREQLLSYGYTCPITVRPILIPFDDYKKEPDKETLESIGGAAGTNEHDIKNILFVGRIAPNKKQEDLISLVYAYKKLYGDKIRLILAGNPSGVEKYNARLKAYAAMLKVEDSVVFTGQISFPKILAYYAGADCFVSMSEHEGFCVPLAEAMEFEVPIIAYASSAIPETLGGTGILLEDKDPGKAAEVLHVVLEDKEIRRKMIEEQNERLSYFSYENISSMFMEQFREFTGL